MRRLKATKERPIMAIPTPPIRKASGAAWPAACVASVTLKAIASVGAMTARERTNASKALRDRRRFAIHPSSHTCNGSCVPVLAGRLVGAAMVAASRTAPVLTKLVQRRSQNVQARWKVMQQRQVISETLLHYPSASEH